MLHTNFNDNLFLLNKILHTLALVQELHVDYDFFKDKVMSDITLLDSAMRKFLSYLEENPHLLERAEHLNTLLTLEQDFVKLITSIVQNENQQNSQDKQNLTILLQHHKKNIDNITSHISQVHLSEEQEMVSNLEMHLLLTEQEDGTKQKKK